MTFSKLIKGTISHSGKYSPRSERVQGMIMHHAAGTNFDVVKNMMGAPYTQHQLSANYLIDSNGDIWGCVPEEYRAFTSADPYWDGRSITFECINEHGSPAWTISRASQEAIAQLLADVAKRYKFTPSRGRAGTVFGHRELWSLFGASYPTACPGALPIDSIVRRSRAIMTNQPIIEEDPMPERKSIKALKKDQSLKSGGAWTTLKTGTEGGSTILMSGTRARRGTAYVALRSTAPVEVRLVYVTVKNHEIVKEEPSVTTRVTGAGTLVWPFSLAVESKGDRRLRVQARPAPGTPSVGCQVTSIRPILEYWEK